MRIFNKNDYKYREIASININFKLLDNINYNAKHVFLIILNS